MTGRLTRRDTLKWLGLVAAAVGASRPFASGAVAHRRGENIEGYGRDPNLVTPPAQPWPLTLTPSQRATAAAVLDVILPGDGDAPPASSVDLASFLDEWVSAPYPEQRQDAAALIPLLDEIDREAARRFAKPLADASSSQVSSLVATYAADTSSHRKAFQRLCVLAAAAYYTSPAGITAIGYVGNEPRLSFDGPPSEVLQRFAAALDRLPGD